ncbi:DUF2815 family protein [Roseburia intestinalis]|uniref:DUF2815 family protein n=1 Tax=Roseburia intestinalis TaxID=166486 RepID=A0A413SP98_9FIRM|nr:DUF2815 family protein [Roseburia intestinalis]RHA69803.1 DUF2815 family protein [Roseburia intestinalis]
MAVTTGKVRLSYCHVWEPQAPLNGQGEAKYSVTILIPKTDTATLNAIYAEMQMAEQQGVASKWNGVKPPIVKNPLYDGDGVRPSGEPFGDECKGHMVITASGKNQPQIVDLQVQPVLNRAEIYSGCYARVNISFFAYAQQGSKGIGCGLNCIQKIEDGEPLSGGVSAQEAFGGNNAYAGAQTTYQMPPQGTYGGAMPQPQYGQPQSMPAAQQMPYPQMQPAQVTPGYPAQSQMPGQQIDPITGQPIVAGGIMGI